jgi:hypothetical protein
MINRDRPGTACAIAAFTLVAAGASPAAASPLALQFARHSTRAAASQAPGWLAPRARSGKNIMYLSSETGDIPQGIYLLPTAGQSQTPIGMISKGTSSPQGISTDAAGNLYVANLGNDTVAVYPPGALSPSATYSKGLIGPYDVAAGPDGTVYVANTSIQSSGQAVGNVVEFAAGTNEPLRTLTLPNYTATAVAIDRSGNLYVAWFDFASFAAVVYEYAPGASQGTNLGLALRGPMWPLYSLAFDPKGNLGLWYQTYSSSPVEYIAAFAPGATEPTTRTQGGASLFNFVFGLTYARSGHAFLAIATYNEVLEVNPPSPMPLDQITLDSVVGVALSPGS